MVLKQYVFLLAGLVLAGSCRSSQGISSGNSKNGNKGDVACNVAVAPGNPVLNWKQERDEVLKGPEMIALPLTYKVYTADSAEMKTFFSAAKLSKADSKAEVVVPLPQPIGCKVFSVFEAGTMSDELKKKFPDIVTLKGADKESALNDIRMEYNGRMMQGQVIWNGETYLVRPVSKDDKFYYLIYLKSEANEPKKDFENNYDKNPRNDLKPVILKYDR